MHSRKSTPAPPAPPPNSQWRRHPLAAQQRGRPAVSSRENPPNAPVGLPPIDARRPSVSNDLRNVQGRTQAEARTSRAQNVAVNASPTNVRMPSLRSSSQNASENRSQHWSGAECTGRRNGSETTHQKAPKSETLVKTSPQLVIDGKMVHRAAVPPKVGKLAPTTTLFHAPPLTQKDPTQIEIPPMPRTGDGAAPPAPPQDVATGAPRKRVVNVESETQMHRAHTRPLLSRSLKSDDEEVAKINEGKVEMDDNGMYTLGERFVFTMDEEIGHGACARVYSGIDTMKDTQEVAIKVLEARTTVGIASLIADFENELEISVAVKCSKTARLLAAFQTTQGCKSYVYLVMKRVVGESLVRPISPRKSDNPKWTPLPPEEIVYLAWDIAAAVEYLHNRFIVHRDITINNVLRNEHSAYLIDFGRSRTLSETENKLHDFAGTLNFVAPEVEALRVRPPKEGEDESEMNALRSAACSEGVDGYKADMYSVGVVFYAMITGHLPFNKTPQESEVPNWEGVPEEWKVVLKTLLHFSPSKRPTATNLRKWIKKMEKSTP